MQKTMGMSTNSSAGVIRPLFSAGTPDVSGRSIFSVMSVSGIEVGEKRIIDDMFRLARRSGTIGGAPLTLTSSVLEQLVENLTTNVGVITPGFCKTKGLYRNHSLVIMDQGETLSTPDSSFSGSGKVAKRLIPLWSDTDERQYVFTINDDYLLHPVGGKIEFGETPLSALHREMTEELGYFKGFKTIPDRVFQRITRYGHEEWNEIYRLVDWTVTA